MHLTRQEFVFRQAFDHQSFTYTYLIADPNSREAAIIDPVLEQHERDLSYINQLGLSLRYILDTHVHADHVTGAHLLRQATSAQYAVGATTDLQSADLLLEDGQEIHLGELELRAIHTPGHTDGCTSYFFLDRVFTGDTLLIRGCGRTDFQQGSSDTLFDSVRLKLFTLPDETLVFPGHDYKGWLCSSIEEEKTHNPRLNLSRSREDFRQTMASLNLAKPKLIDIAVPRNLAGGAEVD